MTDLLLDEKVTRIAQTLERACLPFAFGGAIALAYYAAPRATEDIDLNLFVGVEQAERCLAALGRLGVVGEATERERAQHQLTLFWDHTPIHLFFAYDPFHESCAVRVRGVPFGDGQIPILSSEDISIFKLVYDRPRDRSEVREVLLCMGERMDVRYVLSWLERLLGAGDVRVEGFRGALAELRESG